MRTAALQLLPPLASASSPVAAVISGKTWQMPENADAIKSVNLTFADNTCSFTLEDGGGTHKIEVGLDTPREGTTTMTGNKLCIHEYQPDVMRVVASGTWRDLRTFVMTWTFVESAFRDTVTCTFEGPQMRYARSVNVNSAGAGYADPDGKS